MGVRSFSVKKFKDKNAKRPDVSFGAVDIVFDALWRHVDGWADANVLKLFSWL